MYDISNAQKIVITGISGTGKSTLCRELVEETGLPAFHMDSIIWKEGWIESEVEEVQECLEQISISDQWIIEGWVDTYSKCVFESADLVVYLDYPGWLAAWGGLKRWWQFRGGNRPELPNGCVEEFNLDYLKVMFLRKERPHIESILGEMGFNNLLRLTSRSEVKTKLLNIFKDRKNR